MDMKIIIEIDSVLLICGAGAVFSQVKREFLAILFQSGKSV